MSATNRGAKRLERDAYPTPAWCTEAIVKEIVWDLHPFILEPCSGDGAIVDVIEDTLPSFQITQLDIKYGKDNDFLTFDFTSQRFDFVLTNPPFSLAQEFIDKSLQLANCVIMLLPQSFFGAGCRKEWWQKHPPTAQFILSRRPSFTGNGKTDSEVYSWVVWDSTGRQKRGWHWL